MEKEMTGTKPCSYCGTPVGHDQGCIYQDVEVFGGGNISRKIKVEILSRSDEKITDLMNKLHSKPSPAMGILFAGDRWFCVKQVAVAEIDGEIVGLATIAPEGEQGNDKPTIVSLYIFKEYRSKGIGSHLLGATIEYMVARGMTPISLEVLNSKVGKILDKLSGEKRAVIQTNDQSMGGSTDSFMDR